MRVKNNAAHQGTVIEPTTCPGMPTVSSMTKDQQRGNDHKNALNTAFDKVAFSFLANDLAKKIKANDDKNERNIILLTRPCSETYNAKSKRAFTRRFAFSC